MMEGIRWMDKWMEIDELNGWMEIDELDERIKDGRR